MWTLGSLARSATLPLPSALLLGSTPPPPPQALDSPTPSPHWEGLLPLSASPITRACWDTAHRTAPPTSQARLLRTASSYLGSGREPRHASSSFLLRILCRDSLDGCPPLSQAGSGGAQSPAERPPHVCTERGGALGPPAHPRWSPHSRPLHWPLETVTGPPAPGTWSSVGFGLLPGRAWVWKPAPGPAAVCAEGHVGHVGHVGLALTRCLSLLPPSAPRAFGSNDLFSCRGVFQGTLDLIASLRQEPREGRGCAPDACRETRSEQGRVARRLLAPAAVLCCVCSRGWGSVAEKSPCTGRAVGAAL